MKKQSLFIVSGILIILSARVHAVEKPSKVHELRKYGREGYSSLVQLVSRNPFMPRPRLKAKKQSGPDASFAKQTLDRELVQLNYAKVSDIVAFIKDNDALLSKRGKISMDVRTNRLWIQDHVKHIVSVKRLIQQLDIPVKQVQIEARIVNMTKEAILDLGIHFSGTQTTQLSGAADGATQLLHKGIKLAERLNVDLGPATHNLGTVGLSLAKLGDGILLDLELSALESEDKAEIIASPRLVAANQQAAVIESGEEIPYQETTLSGATAVAFKKAVLSLKVIPQITANNSLLMELEINQDTPSGRLVNGVPSITTKAIHTNVLVNNGQTLVLGGIYKQDTTNTIKQVPFLGDLPVFGNLFRNLHHKVKNEELLIFITPRIITNDLSIAPSKEKIFGKLGTIVNSPISVH
jgi:type IV pilus assembly protein PilQ